MKSHFGYLSWVWAFLAAFNFGEWQRSLHAGIFVFSVLAAAFSIAEKLMSRESRPTRW